VLGKSVTLVDSAQSCARYVQERLASLKLLNSRQRRRGVIQPFVTDETDRFAEVAKRFLSAPTEPPWKVDLAPL
jgi:glutamate racemase